MKQSVLVKKKPHIGNWLLPIIAAVSLLLMSCPAGGGDGEDETISRPDIRKYNKNGVQVINTLWCEGFWQDPRMTMGYRLEKDNKPFFDTYVMLYGGRLTYNNCATNPYPGDEHCQRNGFHLHHPSRAYKILSQWEKYIKPIQDEGIKFIMSLVPGGGGVAHGTLYSWPMQDVWNWEENYKTEYPFGEEATQAFIDQIKEAVRTFHIDGVGFDDEYGNAGGGGLGMAEVYPNNLYYDNSKDLEAAQLRGGQNMFRFAYELKKQIPNFTIECYEIRYGNWMPSEMVLDGKRVKLSEVVDYSYEPMYGSWKTNSGEGPGLGHMPKSRYGPISMDIGSATAGSTAKPPPTQTGVVTNMVDHMAGGYGVNMFFSMSSRRSYEVGNPQYKNFFGSGIWDPAAYFTLISQVLFDDRVTYIGDDYELDF